MHSSSAACAHRRTPPPTAQRSCCRRPTLQYQHLNMLQARLARSGACCRGHSSQAPARQQHRRMWPNGPLLRPLAAGAKASAASAAAAAPQHIILAPPAHNTAPPESECLLVFAPGAGLAPADFRQLAEAAQLHAPSVRLWAACMDLDYQALAGRVLAKHPGASMPEVSQLLTSSGVIDELLAEVKNAAAAAGFQPRTAGWGRVTNLYLCAQSAAGVTMADAAFKGVAGLVLLASATDGRYMAGQLPSLEDWGRPIMVLGAELDGQMRWPWLAPLAVDAAVLAQKAGPSYAAAHQPFVLVPGANHAQTSNGALNAARGDIPARIQVASARAALGEALGAFMAAHEGGGAADRQAAAGVLLGHVRRTAELLAPYFMASGMGDVCSAWVTGRAGGPESTASLDAPDTKSHGGPGGQSGPGSGPSSPLGRTLLQGARRQVGARVSGALHPGVVQKAERFVAAAQLKLASSLPREALGRLRVVVQTHTELEALLFNQPRIEPQPDGSVVVAVHALLALPNVVRPGAALPSCQHAAPEYWLKLKRPQAIAEAMGLAGAFDDGTTAAALNGDALAAALAAVPPAAAQRYAQQGWRLEFAPDEAAPDINAEKFIRQAAMSFNVAGTGPAAAGRDSGSNSGGGGPPGVVAVASPVLTSRSVGETRGASAADGPQAAALAAAVDDPYMHRFLGNWYCKCMSVAAAVEWVMLDCLRERVAWGTPAPAPAAQEQAQGQQPAQAKQQ